MKTELKSLILAGALCASTTAFAQGTVRFDWVEGNRVAPSSDQIFQGTIILDASVVYPGSEPWPRSDPGNFYAYTTGITITSPDSTFLNPGALWPPSPELGNYFDSSGLLHLCLEGFAYDVGRRRLEAVSAPAFTSASIVEYDDNNNKILYSSGGYWKETVIPEPSAFALLGLGLLGRYIKRAAGEGRP